MQAKVPQLETKITSAYQQPTRKKDKCLGLNPEEYGLHKLWRWL